MLGFGSHQDQKEAMFKSKVDTTALMAISRSSGDIARFNTENNANMAHDYSHKVEMENFLLHNQPLI